MRRFLNADIVFYIFLLLLGIGGFFFAIIWPEEKGFYAFTTSASVGGLGVVAYIYYAKKFKKHLSCPVGSNCDVVVKSKYSRFLGIPLEYIGMFYYSVVALSYASLIFFPHLGTGVLLPLILMLTAAAFLFSLYLIFVQAFLLKQWCIWCLLSATLSTGIFIASFIDVGAAGTFFGHIEPIFLLFKHLGFVLGMGGATAVMFMFLKFLNDFDITDDEAETLKKFSELIWLGLGLIFISEYARYVANPRELAQSSIFLAQIIVLSIVFISGAVLSIFFAPFLAVLPFRKKEGKNKENPSPLELIRKWTLVSGAITISSWYFAFLLNYLPEYGIAELLGAYIVVLVASITATLLWEKSISQKPL